MAAELETGFTVTSGNRQNPARLEHARQVATRREGRVTDARSGADEPRSVACPDCKQPFGQIVYRSPTPVALHCPLCDRWLMALAQGAKPS